MDIKNRNKRVNEALSGVRGSKGKLAAYLKIGPEALRQQLTKAPDNPIDSINLLTGASLITGTSFIWLAFGVEIGVNQVSEPPTAYGDCQEQLIVYKDKLIACMEENKRLTAEISELKNFISDHSRAK